MTRRIVTLLGTDGSGKSTICDLLQRNLSDQCSYIYFGLREAQIPFIKRLYATRGDNNLFTRLVLFSFDYFLRSKNLPKDGIVILDRLPGWAIISPNPIIRAIYKRILPYSDMVILCTGDAEKIVARKPERSLEASKKDIQKWHRVLDSLPTPHKLILNTTENDVDSCIHRAMNFLQQTDTKDAD